MPIRLVLTVLFAGVAAAVADPPLEGDHARAGWPLTIRPRAIPSDTGGYVGYYAGGGCPFWRRADGPSPDDGTWGWDYQGRHLTRNIFLGWWHGRRYQGGTGAYKTDGPKLQRPLKGRE